MNTCNGMITSFHTLHIYNTFHIHVQTHMHKHVCMHTISHFLTGKNKSLHGICTSASKENNCMLIQYDFTDASKYTNVKRTKKMSDHYLISFHTQVLKLTQ